MSAKRRELREMKRKVVSNYLKYCTPKQSYPRYSNGLLIEALEAYKEVESGCSESK